MAHASLESFRVEAYICSMAADRSDERALRVVELIRTDEAAIALIANLVAMLTDQAREKKLTRR